MFSWLTLLVYRHGSDLCVCTWLSLFKLELGLARQAIMAVASSRMPICPSWENSDTSHLQCLKKLLEGMETGKTDLSREIVGLPLCPKKDSFKYRYMSK